MKLKNIMMFGAVATLVGCATEPKERPNVLVIILDDAGYNDFSFMGSSEMQTPNIDALAADGVVFTDAHTSASVSGPSRAGLLSGRYQQRFGYECNLEPGFGMDTNETTIADVMGGAGYKTYCIGKWHQGDEPQYHPNKRGFDEFYGFVAGARSYFYEPNSDDAQNSVIKQLQHNGKQVIPQKYMTYELADAAKRFIAEDRAQSPFFMYLAFNAVHTPMQAAKEDMARFEGHPRQTLAAMTYAVDCAIGDVVKTLKEQGLYENTLIFFLSDNGGDRSNVANNFPLKAYKGTKYEGGHRVPYFVTYGDKINKGSRFDGLSSALDIFTTSIAAAGINYTNEERPLDGVNLLPYLKGEKEGDPHTELFWRKNHVKAMRQGDMKLVELDGFGYRLYNLQENIGETEDLSASQPELVQQMRERLSQWESQLVNPILWDEKAWEPVNYERHRANMNNEDVKIYNISLYRKYYNK